MPAARCSCRIAGGPVLVLMVAGCGTAAQPPGSQTAASRVRGATAPAATPEWIRESAAAEASRLVAHQWSRKRNGQITRQLRTIVSGAYNKTPLRKVVADLARRGRFAAVIDEQGLVDERIEPRTLREMIAEATLDFQDSEGAADAWIEFWTPGVMCVGHDPVALDRVDRLLADVRERLGKNADGQPVRLHGLDTDRLVRRMHPITKSYWETQADWDNRVVALVESIPLMVTPTKWRSGGGRVVTQVQCGRLPESSLFARTRRCIGRCVAT